MCTKQEKMGAGTLHEKSPTRISVACKLVYDVKDPVDGRVACTVSGSQATITRRNKQPMNELVCSIASDVLIDYVFLESS